MGSQELAVLIIVLGMFLMAFVLVGVVELVIRIIKGDDDDNPTMPKM